MRYMSIVKGRENQGTPPAGMYEAVDALAKEMFAKGVLVALGGLMPSANSTTANITKGNVRYTDGPYAEAREVIGGFAIYEVKSREEMMEWTRRFLQLHLDLWPSWEGQVEIRELVAFETA